MRSLFILATLFTSSFAFASLEASPTAKQKFCEERLSSKYAVQQVVSRYQNQLSLMNQGGLFNGGVCWWHSRFTRAAAYLAVFDPSLPRPSDDEAKKIIDHIRKRKGMVVVPGFRNLWEFSLYYQKEILNKLEDWQRSDGLFKLSWVKGMMKEKDIAPEKLEKKMDDLFARVQNGEVVYQMLQIPGIMAHSWLVVGMTRTNYGYNVIAVDSNAPGDALIFPYYRGETRIEYADTGMSFVPYDGNVNEERKLRKKMENACANIIDNSEDDED